MQCEHWFLLCICAAQQTASTSFPLDNFSSFQLESPRQTEDHRSKLLSTYSAELLYQAKRKCNATQEFDIDLHEGEVVAVVEQKDPFQSTSRWLVDTGSKFSAQTSQ